jgi:hypothetical protein
VTPERVATPVPFVVGQDMPVVPPQSAIQALFHRENATVFPLSPVLFAYCRVAVMVAVPPCVALPLTVEIFVPAC